MALAAKDTQKKLEAGPVRETAGREARWAEFELSGR